MGADADIKATSYTNMSLIIIIAVAPSSPQTNMSGIITITVASNFLKNKRLKTVRLMHGLLTEKPFQQNH